MASRKDSIQYKAITTRLAWHESMTWMLARDFSFNVYLFDVFMKKDNT